MYQATGVAVKNGLSDEFNCWRSLSISLAIFNLLPIPDPGRRPSADVLH